MVYTIPKTTVIDYPPAALQAFSVYGYEWIDNLHFTIPADRFIAEPSEYLKFARQRFLDAGWAGDGDIEVMWIPPFVFPVKSQTPAGVVVWHVKQQDDGISFLLSPVPLPFEEFSPIVNLKG